MSKLYKEPKTALLKEFVQNHTVKFHYGMSEIKAVVIGFTKKGVVVREYGQQDHKEYKAEEISFISDLGIE